MDSIIAFGQNTNVLAVGAAAIGFLLAMQMTGKRPFVDRFVATEMMLRKPVSLAVIAAVTSIMFGIGVVSPPSRLVNLLKTPWARMLALFLTGLTASGDIETSFMATAMVAILLQLARTPEERRRHPYMV